MDLSELRQSYTKGGLTEEAVHPDPIVQFQHWFEEARQTVSGEVNAMFLATTGLDGGPNLRTVLLKSFDIAGFVFYTNFESQKGREISANPNAALLFYWAELERQVRIRGTVTKTDSATSDRYFDSRPRGHQLGAWASAQSAIVSGRDELDRQLASTVTRFAEAPVTRPPHWGGYLVFPIEIEFWQGRPNRLHDRLVYKRNGNGWDRARLSP